MNPAEGKEFPMRQYLDLLRKILDEGHWKHQRAKLAGTTSLRTRALFGLQTRYDLNAGFPLVTTKRVSFRLIREELLWFLSGSTNNRDLNARGVTIWDEWADERTGELGPIYGQQWRRWECVGGGTYDQVRALVNNIRSLKADPEHPSGRRLLLTALNPPDVLKMRGPSACHTLAQFDVTEGRLSCQFYQRSADTFLGVPFNIACYALLTHLLAKVTGLGVGELIHTFGDAHVYENHLPQVREQLSREPLPLPRLVLDDAITDVDGIRSEQIRLEGYVSHPPLKGEVAV
jgi:thymidylate synthase